MSRAFVLTNLAALTLALAACGGGEKTSEASPPEVSAPAPADTPASPAAAVAPAAAGGATLQVASFVGDAASGRKLFAQCRSCHVVEPGVNRVGPTLHGVVGRRAGSEPDYSYSAAQKDSGLTWTEQTLFEYLENPRKYVPGTKMSYAGMKNPQQRADLIAYLKTQR